jgi:two-component SAPR family response regulator
MIKTWAISILTLIACCGTSVVVFAVNTAKIHRAETEELRQQLDAVNKQLDSCYEGVELFRNDYFECERNKGFEWKEDMKLVCSHFTEED